MADDIQTFPLDSAPSGGDLTTTPMDVSDALNTTDPNSGNFVGDYNGWSQDDTGHYTQDSTASSPTTVTSDTTAGGDQPAAQESTGESKTAEQQQQDNAANPNGDTATTEKPPVGGESYELEEVVVTARMKDPNPTDTRVRIIVPESYRTAVTTGEETLDHINGIIFPYTPSINYNYKAEYRDQSVTHTNFKMNFYTRSYVSDIQIQGKFTVQNDKDAKAYIATHHMLRALTKMRFGKDINAGAPPPVCRLKAYGSFILHDTPIVITDFRVDLPSDVDYYKLWNEQVNKLYAKNTAQMIPVVSTVTITCTPMYSRDEMLKFNVTQMLFEEGRLAGYL